MSDQYRKVRIETRNNAGDAPGRYCGEGCILLCGAKCYNGAESTRLDVNFVTMLKFRSEACLLETESDD